MKKLIAMLLILAMIIPMAALADDSDVVGCWSSYTLTNVGSPMMTMMYISEDHTCYYLTQYFHADEAGIGRTYIGTWELKDNKYLVAKTGDNTETILYLSSSMKAGLETRTNSLFVNISAFD